ncbi:MAG: hypothetical protein GYA36_19280 [Veillonellaceae bacterium]|nr:hypothetical protein [Veillonellaceae bacterium]
MTDTCSREPILTPWPSLNEALGGGLYPGFYALVGKTGAGRTQFAMQAALAAAKAGTPVWFVSWQSGPFELGSRLLGLTTDIRWPDLVQGRVSMDDLRQIGEVSVPLSGIPLLCDLVPRQDPITADDIIGGIRHVRVTEGTPDDRNVLVVLDSPTLRDSAALKQMALDALVAAGAANAAVLLIPETDSIDAVADPARYVLSLVNEHRTSHEVHLDVLVSPDDRPHRIDLLFDGTTFREKTPA